MVNVIHKDVVRAKWEYEHGSKESEFFESLLNLLARFSSDGYSKTTIESNNKQMDVYQMSITTRTLVAIQSFMLSIDFDTDYEYMYHTPFQIVTNYTL